MLSTGTQTPLTVDLRRFIVDKKHDSEFRSIFKYFIAYFEQDIDYCLLKVVNNVTEINRLPKDKVPMFVSRQNSSYFLLQNYAYSFPETLCNLAYNPGLHKFSKSLRTPWKL